MEIPVAAPKALLADKGYDGDSFRESLLIRGTAALDMAIKTAMTNGNLMEVKKVSLVEQFNFHGAAYRALCLT